MIRLAAWLALLAAGCAESNSATVVELPPPQQPDLPPPVAAPPPVAQPAGPARPEVALLGDWRGSYTCAQGETALELHVSRVNPDVAAVFVFSHGGSGAQGSYAMFGNADPSGDVVLQPKQWIDRPPSYIMVGMRGTVSGDVFRGKMQHASCGDFELHRVR